MAQKNTREKLLEHAQILFSQKGFYGTSINDVAKELSVSKQALLHHFSNKEKLYAEVLQQAAEKLQTSLQEAQQHSEQPRQQLLYFLKDISAASGESLRVVILLMRELLDNRDRAEQAHKWFLRPFLDELVHMTEKAQIQGHIAGIHPLAFIYQLLGAVQYFVISQPTLKQLYSQEEFAQHQQQHSALLDKLLS